MVQKVGHETEHEMPEFRVDNCPMWFDVFGEGPHVVLLIPGAIGTAQSDFQTQLDPSNPNCLDMSRFTFVCVELPGWGRSCPPSRPYGSQVLQHDAKCCMALMQHLGYEKYSILGWSDGGKVSLIIARKSGPLTVRCVVVLGVITYSSAIGTKHMLWSRNLDNWDQELLDKYIKAYGGDRRRVMQLWSAHMDFIGRFAEFYPDGILGAEPEGLSQIKVPTLALHGDKDFFAELGQVEHVCRLVPNCQMVRFMNAAHNLHQTEAKKFKEVVERFLTETGQR